MTRDEEMVEEMAKGMCRDEAGRLHGIILSAGFWDLEPPGSKAKWLARASAASLVLDRERTGNGKTDPEKVKTQRGGL